MEAGLIPFPGKNFIVSSTAPVWPVVAGAVDEEVEEEVKERSRRVEDVE